MATTIKDSVYKAIDVIVGKRIEDLHLDKTIEATIEYCVDMASKKYRLRYGSGVFDAYAINDDVYTANTAVYVLIPENDFNKRKTIIGKANTGSQTNAQEEQSIATMYSGYGVIGQNILSSTENRFNLQSYMCLPSIKENAILLYDANRKDKDNQVHIDNEKLKIYLEEAKGFIFSGKFKTNFNSTQSLSGNEDYGLIFNLALKNGTTSFENMQARWEVQEPKTINGDNRLNNYKTIIDNIFINETDVQIIQKQLYNQQIKLQAYATELEYIDADTLELVDLYIQLISDLVNYDVNINGEAISKAELQAEYNSWFTNPSYAFQEDEYTVWLDTSKMTGNVYHYSEPTYQYTFAEIDADRFVRINSIYFYCKNFSYKPELAAIGDDIQVSDVSITCIKYLDNVNGNYRLDLEYEDIYFNNNSNDEDTLTIKAKLIYKDTTDVTSYSRIMWFRQNSNITPEDTAYSMYAGQGWEHITSDKKTSYDRSPTLIIKAKDNKVYRNKYKVIGMYESGTIVQQEFIIYNDQHKHNIELVSDSGLTFGEGSGRKKITCLIDNSSNVSDDYIFTWYKQSSDGSRYKILDSEGIATLKESIENIEQSLEDAEENQTSFIAQRASQKAEYNALENITWEGSNYIYIDAAAVPNRTKVNIICAINTKTSNAYLGEVDLTLTSGYSINLKSYYIEIVNGNQVFQYNEAGISPSSTIYEDPLVPQPLSCNFYDPNGGIINPLKYNVSWQIPVTNTLIHIDDNSLIYNPVTEQYDIWPDSTCNFVISNEYNYGFTNNQIVCIVEFNDGDGLVTYRQPTNFFFGKIGDDGTNGTDIVAKIDVVNNKHSNSESDYNNNTLVNELLTLKIEEQINTDETRTYNTFWNNGLNTNDAILQLQLYRKNALIDSSEYRKVNWSVLSNGLTSKYWRTQNSSEETTNAKQAILLYDQERNNNNKSYTNYIIKAQADLPIDEKKYQTYYNFYPICTDTKYQIAPNEYVINKQDRPSRAITTKTIYNNYYVGIDRARTLRQVVYNSDGRNPQYDKNLGVGLSFKNLDYPRTIVWEPHGGPILTDKEGEIFPAFTLGKNISYIATYDEQIDNIIADLEYQQRKELEAIEEQQQQDIGNTILQSIDSQLNSLQLQYTGIEIQRDTLINSRIEQWNSFCGQQQNIVETMFTKLYNLIDSKVENDDWHFEDYIYMNNSKYYFMHGAFQNDLFNNYLAKKFQVDNIDNNTVINTDVIKDIEEVLTSLEFIIELENETDKENIEQSFNTLINLAILGYQAYKIVYDRKIKDISNQIDEYAETLIELTATQNDYANAKSVMQNIIRNGADEIWEIIKAVLFGHEDANDNLDELEDETLISVILSLQTQFASDILAIKNKYGNQIDFLNGIITDDTDPTYCSITPNEVYSGEYANQYVKVKIYQGLTEDFSDELLEHELIIPFHMSLNTYGLASLNVWDGNSIEINEDEGYVLAPQIGAGIKHTEDNTFTGVLMGTEKTFDDAEGQEEIGLLGYSHGKRSIFLDASTGNATFGLPETDAADVSNPLTEGRIELRPGGTSSISKWNFDSRSIYRVSTGDEEEAMLQTKAYTKQMSATSLGAPYEDAPQYAHGSIPHTKQGILLSALPAYASFKGRILTEEDQTDQRVNYLNLNTSVREGDTFELQIDPNDSRFFSLYEHSTRIYEGYGTCDTLNGYSEEDKYPMTQEEFNEYFAIFIDRTNRNWQNIDKENTIILTQRYLQTTGNESKQIFRPLAYLYQQNNTYYWKLINTTVDKRGRETSEYVVALLKQYRDWQNNNEKQTVWTYITFIPEDSTLTNVPLKATYDDDDNLIGLSLPNKNIINENTKVWHRYKKAGIDSTGKFVSEGVGTGAIGLGLNDIQAFTLGSLFIGANFESNNGSVVQFFIDKLSNSPTAPLFISSTKTLTSSADNNDEGRRPIRIYAGQDYENLNTGIFVGKNSAKNPIEKIAKIELSQTGPDDNKIILSALGSDPVEGNQSVLTLNTNNETNAQGSLVHTGSWNTEIGKVFNATIGGNITVSGAGTGANSIKLSGTLSGSIYDNNGTYNNNITINKTKFELKHQANNLLLLNNDSSIFNSYKQIQIIGGKGNTAGSAATNSIIIHAQNSSSGLLLAASNNAQYYKVTRKNNTSFVPPTSNGTSYFQLFPSIDTNSNNARFFLFAGTHSYIYSGAGLTFSNDHKNMNAVIIGPHIKVNDNGAGFIQCNGRYISNTVDGSGAGPSANKTLNPDYGASDNFIVPQISVSTNGRPKFTNRTITIKMPKQVDLRDYAKKSDLKAWVTRAELDDILASYVKANHTHRAAASSSNVVYGYDSMGKPLTKDLHNIITGPGIVGSSTRR